MNIVFYKTEEKLPLYQHAINKKEAIESGLAWFWIIHPVDFESFIEEDLEDDQEFTECIERRGGVLVISGSPRCGLTEEKAIYYEKKENGRLHFLRTSCPDDPNSNAANKIINFLKTIENLSSREDIPWELLQAEIIPQNLLAFYLLTKAINLSSKISEQISQIWQNMDNNWRENLIKNAMSEYEARCPEKINFSESLDLYNEEVNTDLLNLANQSAFINSIRDCLYKT